MANKTAPYNNPQTMNKIDQWWSASFPTNRTGVMHIIELYKSFEEYTKMDVYSPDWIDANQFAKCLVASRITDIGGWWARLDTWEPKEYEIKRAKVY